jgi:hypothetical protein
VGEVQLYVKQVYSVIVMYLQSDTVFTDHIAVQQKTTELFAQVAVVSAAIHPG